MKDSVSLEDLFSMQVFPSYRIHNNQEVWNNKYITLILREQYNTSNWSIMMSDIKEPFQLIIPYKEWVKEYYKTL